MIRSVMERVIANGVLMEAYGLSCDAKPTEGLLTGSKFTEVDTGIEYLFDEDSGAWTAINSGNGKTGIAAAAVTLGTSLTYTGSEQTQTVSTVKLGSTSLTENTDYEVTDNKATDAGDYTLKIIGKGDYAGGVAKLFTIAKADGSVTPEDDSLSLTVGTDGETEITVVGDGELTAASDDTSVATVSIDTDNDTITLIVVPVSEGTATVTVTLSDDANYNGDSADIAVTVVAADDSVS